MNGGNKSKQIWYSREMIIVIERFILAHTFTCSELTIETLEEEEEEEVKFVRSSHTFSKTFSRSLWLT